MNSALETLPTIALRESLSWCLTQAAPPVVRPISQWVEDEIVLPSGPFKGERYRHDRHPASRLWYREIDSGLWSRFALTAPQQNGKTLVGFATPVLWHLLEIGETVIVGLPSMDMACDKWAEDFLPVIEASDYRDLLPLKGEGSKGGQVKRSVTFRNGATLRFMTAGGSDKQRAGFTSRVVAVTETDGMDQSSTTSREADAIEQLEGRSRAFGRRGKRIYLECTTSINTGKIWQELKGGTDSRIVRPCHHCGEFVAPEREHLLGWQAAESEDRAAELAHWTCPACAVAWDEQQRRDAAAKAVLVHRGQTIDRDGRIEGDRPETETLGFRWSAIDNPFTSAADLGAEEWKSQGAADRENAERKMRQFVWAIPFESPDVDVTPLDPKEVSGRKSGLNQRDLPPDALGTVVGIDTGKKKLHWTVYAVRPNGSLPVVEYGIQPVDADRLGIFKGLLVALHQLKDYLDGGKSPPAQVWIDSGWHEHTDAVYEFCGAANLNCQPGKERYRPTKGYGEGQNRIGRYAAPAAKMADVVFVGREYHIAKVRRQGRLLPGVLLVHINSDYWKSELHQRLLMPVEEPGAVTLWDSPDPHAHAEYVSHHIAERQLEKFMKGRGTVTVWDRLNRTNHYFDAGYSGVAAGDFVLGGQVRRAPKPRVSMRQLQAAARKL